MKIRGICDCRSAKLDGQRPRRPGKVVLCHALGFAGLALMVLWLSSCKTPPSPRAPAPPTPPPPTTTVVPPPAPAQPALRAEKLAEMDAAVAEAIAGKKCPGGVLWFEHRGAAYHKAYGKRALVPAPEPMTEDTLFDAASLTKVVACAPAVMLLVERGRVKLDEPAQTYLPEFKGAGKEAITIRQLLTHTSGLRGDIETRTDWQGRRAALRSLRRKALEPPGAAFRYSDINFLVLGEIVQRVSGTPLEEFVAREIYRPLKMTDTGYLPPESKRLRIAPTEVVNGRPFRGVVHDPTARQMGGVAGHAACLPTAADLARYARMLLNEGASRGRAYSSRDGPVDDQRADARIPAGPPRAGLGH